MWMMFSKQLNLMYMRDTKIQVNISIRFRNIHFICRQFYSVSMLFKNNLVLLLDEEICVLFVFHMFKGVGGGSKVDFGVSIDS